MQQLKKNPDKKPDMPRKIATPAKKPVAAKAKKPIVKQKPKVLKAVDVLAYLKAHPKFLETHATQLAKASKTPKKLGNVFSLAAARAGSAETQAASLKKRLTQLIAVAKANAQAQTQAHEAIVALVGANTATAFSKALQGPFRAALGLQAARFLKLAAADSATTLSETSLKKLCAHDMALGPVQAGLHSGLFGPQTATLKSCALLRLETEGKPLGLLALGSEQAEHFHAGQDVSLVAFLRQVASLRVQELGTRN